MLHCIFVFVAATAGYFLPSVATSGDVDADFGNNGNVITDFFDGTDVGNNLVIDKSGRIILAGSATKRTVSDHFALARYDENGNLDTSFGRDGRVVTRYMTDEKIVYGGIMGLGLLSDGTIITSGRGQFSGLSGFAVVAYRDDGSLDTSLFLDGASFVPDENTEIYPLALTVDAQDRIIIVASSFEHDEANASFAVYRFLKDGSLDMEFGTLGKVITNITSGRNVPRAVAIDTNGNIVVGGFNGNSKFVVTRYSSNGILDARFGLNGIATIHFNSGGTDTLNALALQSDGKILVGGDVQVGSFAGIRMIDFGIARLTSDGQLDLSFNQTGTQITYFGQPAASSLWALALQSDSKIIAVGDASVAKGLAIARYNRDGSLDTSFAKDGKQIIPFHNTCHWEGVALNDQQKIVVGGYVWNGKHYDMAITQLLND